MAEFRFHRMVQFRFEALTADGAEVRDTVEALDHQSARDSLEQKGLFVYRMKTVNSPDDLEQRCPECHDVNNWSVMVCANCGAPLRGRHVGSDEEVELTELPQGFVIRENSDGSVTLTKTGWRRWERVVIALAGNFWAFVIFQFANGPGWQFARTVFGVLGFALIPYTLWALFARDEWHVGEGFCEQKRSLFGMDWGHTFRVGIIRLHHRNDREGNPFDFCVSVLDRETSRTLCRDHSESAARAMAAFLAQRTGWVLDDQISDMCAIEMTNMPSGWGRISGWSRRG